MCLYEINADSTWQPLATVLGAAKILGHKSTGLVVTVKVSHATPAGTASHVVARTEDANIMRQIASNGVDVVFGGGIKYMDDDVKSLLEEREASNIRRKISRVAALWILLLSGRCLRRVLWRMILTEIHLRSLLWRR